VDFCVTKGISPDYISARSCFELSSDHTPILITLSVETSLLSPHPSLCNNNTNWEAFRLLITEHLHLNVPLKTTHDIEAAINSFNNLIQRAGWDSTPEPPKIPRSPTCPLLIKQKILIKRRLRRKVASTSTSRNTIIVIIHHRPKLLDLRSRDSGYSHMLKIQSSHFLMVT
jgi:hypothetical protein